VPDALRDEEVMACIVPMSGIAAEDALAQRLFAWCNTRLAYYKAPGWIIFRDSLPTTGTQKVQKTQLFAEGDAPTAGAIDLRQRKRKKR
jgi:crotonobetaine/carnitine-CoA ligase